MSTKAKAFLIMKLPEKFILNLLFENLLRLRKFELIGIELIFSFFLFFLV